MHPSIQPLEKYGYFVGGVGGEIARGFWYLDSDVPRDGIPAEDLVRRMGLPLVEPVRAEVERWIAQAPSVELDQLLDLAYIELRLGSWGFASAYTEHPATQIQPFVSRRGCELMIGLERQQKKQNPFRDWMSRRHPELLSVPVNSYGDARDAVTIAMKLIQPHRVANKVRRLAANAISSGRSKTR